MRIYRLLLYLYPASFRADYGGEMEAVFRIHLRDTGGAARVALWFGVLHEVIMRFGAVRIVSSRVQAVTIQRTVDGHA